VDVLYNIKRKKYQTVCAELAFAKSPSTEWSWFCIELIIRFLYLLCSWIIAIFKECLNKSRQSLLFLLNAAFLAEKQHIPILYSFVWQDRGSYPQSIALEASTLTITLPMRYIMVMILYRTYNSFSLFAMQLNYCNIQRVFEQK
jgi:hypothetical protein